MSTQGPGTSRKNDNSGEGSVFKRCSCKDPGTGRRLNAACPKLYRSGGGWHPHHGSWGYQLELPQRPGLRRRQLRRTSGFALREAAAAELDHAGSLLDLAGTNQQRRIEIADMLDACKRGTPLPDRDTVAKRVKAGAAVHTDKTTAECLTTWLNGRRGLAEHTMRGYSDHIRLYLIPYLGEVAIQDLDHRHINAMYDALDERNADIIAAKASPDPRVQASVRGVRPLGDSSLQRLHATLRKFLNDMIHTYHLRDSNPAIGVELRPQKKRKPKVWTSAAVAQWQKTGERPGPVMVWTPAQAGEFLDFAERHDIALYPMFLLILHRGLRRGEGCGLREHDVDFDDHIITVVQQITSVGYQPVTRFVKSDAGERIIPTGPKTEVVLADYRRRRDGCQKVSGADWPDTGLFFVRPDGRAWHPQAVSDRFEHLVIKSGLPPVRLHDLRHAAATYLRAGGADLKEVQELLGHARVGTTSDIYTSVLLEFQRAHADTAADLIPRRPSAAA